jgi:hypothetical protein
MRGLAVINCHEQIGKRLTGPYGTHCLAIASYRTCPPAGPKSPRRVPSSRPPYPSPSKKMEEDGEIGK